MNTSEPRQAQSLTVERIEKVVRELLLDDDVVLTADTQPRDVEGWDSLANVSIMFALEEEFRVRLSDALATGFETVGDLASLIEQAQA